MGTACTVPAASATQIAVIQSPKSPKSAIMKKVVEGESAVCFSCLLCFPNRTSAPHFFAAGTRDEHSSQPTIIHVSSSYFRLVGTQKSAGEHPALRAASVFVRASFDRSPASPVASPELTPLRERSNSVLYLFLDV